MFSSSTTQEIKYKEKRILKMKIALNASRKAHSQLGNEMKSMSNWTIATMEYPTGESKNERISNWIITMMKYPTGEE